MTGRLAAALPAAPGLAPAQAGAGRLLLTLFFFSGFPALIYQLVWQRALFRIFGVNIESVTIVVTAFMLGLGLGGLVGGWVSKRPRWPLLLLLGVIEALTGLFGLFSLWIFESVGTAVLGAPLGATALITLGLVLVPTLLMGATLPLLVAHLVRRGGSVGAAVGSMYHANTLGAGAACLVSAMLLFPYLGMHGSVQAAVALNVAVACAAVLAHVFDRRLGPPPASPAPAAPSNVAALPFGLVLAMAAAGGLVSLSYEIFFFRTMSYASGSSAFAFATTLGAFLIGLACGARVAGEACATATPKALLRTIQRNLLCASAVGFMFLPALKFAATLGAGMLGVGLLLVFVLALNWGVVLPCLAHLGIPADASAGQRTGLLYLCNILGAAAGSLLTGFLLMDRLGLIELAQVLVGTGLFCTLLLSAGVEAPRRKRAAHAAGLACLLLLAVALLPQAGRGTLEALLWKGRPEAATPFADVVENRSGIITVDNKGTVFGNGAYDGHFGTDLVHDVNGIVRPFALSLFHAAPRDVLMVGLASGSWAQVVANHPDLVSLTVVEINPGYARLVAGNPEVASVLAHPKVRFVVDDGRRWLRLNTQRRFDAIVINSTFHHRANATNLLSTDFLALAKSHLNHGGVLFYNTTESARVQRTGCSAFEHGARFTNHMVLSATPIDWNFARWRRTLEAYRIEGRPVINLAMPGHAEALNRLMASETQLRSRSGGPMLEDCADLRVRTAGQALVTDDNMGSEWRLSKD